MASPAIEPENEFMLAVRQIRASRCPGCGEAKWRGFPLCKPCYDRLPAELLDGKKKDGLKFMLRASFPAAMSAAIKYLKGNPRAPQS